MSEAIEIRDGIEFYSRVTSDGRDFESESCARCGSSVEWVSCPNCDEFGASSHDCGEDCCVCLYPENNVTCDWCNGTGGALHCISSPEWCQANPLPGRESIESTAMSSDAWRDAL